MRCPICDGVAHTALRWVKGDIFDLQVTCSNNFSCPSFSYAVEVLEHGPNDFTAEFCDYSEAVTGAETMEELETLAVDALDEALAAIEIEKGEENEKR